MVAAFARQNFASPATPHAVRPARLGRRAVRVAGGISAGLLILCAAIALRILAFAPVGVRPQLLDVVHRLLGFG